MIRLLNLFLFFFSVDVKYKLFTFFLKIIQKKKKLINTKKLTITENGSIDGTMIYASTVEYSGNVDDLKRTGFYRSEDVNTNNPTGHYYSIVVFGNQGNVTAQIAVRLQSTETYVRSFNNSWTSWARLDT